jgi:hypothetical protein
MKTEGFARDKAFGQGLRKLDHSMADNHTDLVNYLIIDGPFLSPHCTHCIYSPLGSMGTYLMEIKLSNIVTCIF